VLSCARTRPHETRTSKTTHDSDTHTVDRDTIHDSRTTRAHTRDPASAEPRPPDRHGRGRVPRSRSTSYARVRSYQQATQAASLPLHVRCCPRGSHTTNYRITRTGSQCTTGLLLTYYHAREQQSVEIRATIPPPSPPPHPLPPTTSSLHEVIPLVCPESDAVALSSRRWVAPSSFSVAPLIIIPRSAPQHDPHVCSTIHITTEATCTPEAPLPTAHTRDDCFAHARAAAAGRASSPAPAVAH
jgi:hypothetical protein